MNKYKTLVKREFWEHRGAFLYMPVVLAGLLVIAMIVGLYLIDRANVDISLTNNDSSFVIDFDKDEIKDANSDLIEQQVEERVEQQIEQVIESTLEDAVNPGEPNVKKLEERHIFIQFDEGDVVVLNDQDQQQRLDGFFEKNREGLDAGLYGIHYAFLITSWLVVLVYLLNTLYNDRRDRSILFWKSMPFSETQSVGVKLLVGIIAVPLLATLASWVVQLVYSVLAMLVASKMDLDPWQVIAPNLHIASAFVRQLGLVVYLAVWALPVCAWLMVASAYAKRSPFLVATVPVVLVFLGEWLLFRTSHIAAWIGSHMPINENFTDVFISGTGIISTLDLASVANIGSGAAIAAGLLAGAVWLRNHRFEI